MASPTDEKTPAPPPGSASSTKAVRGASLLILLQVLSRAITFIANQLLLRFLTAQLLGIATQLEVYYLTVIFFARESLRVAIQRQDTTTTTTTKNATPNSSAQAAINLGYLSIALGIPLALLFGYLYRASLAPTTVASTPYLLPSLYLYALASILELLSEPSYVLLHSRLQFSTRALAESTATLLRCVTTLLTASLLPGTSGVLPFAAGQLASSLSLLVIYTLHTHRLARTESFSLLPTPLPRSQLPGGTTFHHLLPTPPLRLASSLLAQSAVKHLLTQGDTLLVSVLCTPSAQGTYALASAYGSLLSRLVFLPIEDASRAYFSRTPSLTSLTSILHSYLLFSLLLLSLAPPAAPLLLSLVAGPRWAGSGAGECLAAYMYYLPLLAVNGVAEAFVSSVASEGEVHAQSAWMGAFSAGFAGAGVVFLRVLGWGAEGLVWANGINMACRIVWCGVFITRWFGRRGMRVAWGEVVPRPVGVGAAVVAGWVVRRVVDGGVTGWRETLGQLVRVAGVGVVLLGVLMFSERRFLQSSYEALRGKTKTS